MKRVLCFILCLTVLFSLVGCGEVGSGSVHTETVLKVGDFKVTMDEYLYLCYKYRQAYDKGDPTYWDTHPEKEAQLFQEVLLELCAIYAVHDLAKEYKVKLDSDDKDTVNSIIRSYILDYQEDVGNKKLTEKEEEELFEKAEAAYLADAAKSHMTGDLVRAEESFRILQQKLYEYLTDERVNVIQSDDAVIEGAIAAGEFYRVEYLLIQHAEEDDASVAANRLLAQELQQEIASGKDVKEVAAEALRRPLGEDETLTYHISTHSGDGSYFIQGYLSEEEEAVVLALPENGVSGVIETDAYLCIYRRLPCDPEYMNGKGFQDLRSLYQQRGFTRLCDQRAAELYQQIKFKSPYEGAFSVR